MQFSRSVSTLSQVLSGWNSHTLVPHNFDYMHIIVYFTVVAYMKLVQRDHPYFMPNIPNGALTPLDQLLIPDITQARFGPGYEMGVFRDFALMVRPHLPHLPHFGHSLRSTQNSVHGIDAYGCIVA